MLGQKLRWIASHTSDTTSDGLDVEVAGEQSRFCWVNRTADDTTHHLCATRVLLFERLGVIVKGLVVVSVMVVVWSWSTDGTTRTSSHHRFVTVDMSSGTSFGESPGYPCCSVRHRATPHVSLSVLEGA